MPRSVGYDKLTLWRSEVAVGHVDRDALLALGAKAIGEEREVDVFITAGLGAFLHGFELILENGLTVVKEAPNKCAFAVVDGTCGGEPQKIHIKVAGCRF